MTTKTLEELVIERIALKREEDAAAAARKAIDATIADILRLELESQGKAKGTVTQRCEGAGVKVVCGFSLTRSVDAAAVTEKFDELPAVIRELFRWKPEVIETRLESLSDADKVLASAFVTTKPASPSIKIEVL